MVKIVENIFNTNVNKQIINILKTTQGWYFGYDSKEIDFDIDQGIALKTFDDKLNIEKKHNFDLLNFFAFMVAEETMKKINKKYKQLKRVNYNFYHTLSSGSKHVDSTTPGCVSILYNLNKNDGFLEIDGKRYFSEESTAYVFDSSKEHRGQGSTNQLRYNLNIVLHT